MRILIVLVILFILLLYYYNTEYNIFRDYKYFDSNGTTPIHQKALNEYVKCAYLGNASAEYASHAKFIMLRAKQIVSDWTNAHSYNIIFNSGASEGNNNILVSLALANSKPHFILSSLEHKTSIDCADNLEKAGLIEVSYIPATSVVYIENIEPLIRPNTVLISVMHVNNETGGINDIYSIGALAKKHNIYFHSDMVQSFGKYPVDMKLNNLDAITTSMHKLHGPLGIGVMVLSPRLSQVMKQFPLIAGSQYSGIRGGTENIPGIAAALKTMEITFCDRAAKNEHLHTCKHLFLNILGKTLPIYPSKDILDNIPAEAIILLSPEISVPNTILLSIRPGKICNVKLKKELYKKKYIISIGSTCNTNNPKPSHVLTALRLPKNIRSSTIRISFNDYTTLADVKALAELISSLLYSDSITYDRL